MQFDVEYDVVVVGGGGSGKSAAYTIATESDLSVLVLEKMKETGGTSQFAEGTCASESCEQIARGIPDYPEGYDLPEGAHFPTREEHYKRYLEYSHHRANPEVVRSFVWNSAETISILKSIGVEYSDVTLYAFDQDTELYTFHRPVGLGARVQELLLRACINSGVDIFTSTPGKELIKEDGRIVGIKAEDSEGNEIAIGCKAVILATGGFADNREMVKEHSWIKGIDKGLPNRDIIDNSGDGIRMAIAAGCDTKDLGTIMTTSRAVGKTRESPLSVAGQQPALWVNVHGRRFYNEAVGHSFADCANVIAQQDGNTIYVIHDAGTLQVLKDTGSEIGLGDFIPFAKIETGVEAAAQESMDAGDGCGWIADSLEELADRAGLPKEAFLATVERYNALCDDGFDEDLFKPAKYMRPIRTAPFVAIRKAAGINVSSGGLRVNGDMQCTDENYRPIPGLYAVGNEASGLYGDTYNLDCPGTANGFAHTSGRIAARHAIKVIKGE